MTKAMHHAHLCSYLMQSSHYAPSRATPSPNGTAEHLAVDNHTSVGVDRLPAQLLRIRAGQENHTCCDFAWLSRSSHRRSELLDRIVVHCCRDKWRPDWPRSYGIDSDTLADELVRETTREGNDGALCGGVVEEIWSANVGVYGGVVDDGVAFLHVRQDVFGEVEEGCCKQLVSVNFGLRGLARS